MWRSPSQHLRLLENVPLAAAPACRAFADHLTAGARVIGDLLEVAAEAAVTAVFAGRHDIAVASAMTPLVTLADASVEAVVIGTLGVGTVLTVDVARDRVAREAAEDRAAHYGAAVAMADRAADHAAGNRADDGAARMVTAAAGVGLRAARARAERKRRCRKQQGGFVEHQLS